MSCEDFNSDLKKYTPEHDLTIQIILERIKRGYYRQASAVEDEIKRCFMIRASFKLMGLTDKLQAVMANFLSSGDGFGDAATFARSLKTISEAERDIIGDVLFARKCYSTAILSIREPSKCEWAFNARGASSGLAASNETREDNFIITGSETSLNVANKSLIDVIAKEKFDGKSENMKVGTGREILPRISPDEKSPPDLLSASSTKVVVAKPIVDPVDLYVKVCGMGGAKNKGKRQGIKGDKDSEPGIFDHPITFQVSDFMGNSKLTAALCGDAEFRSLQRSNPIANFLNSVGSKRTTLKPLESPITTSEGNHPETINTLGFLTRRLEEQKRILVDSALALNMAQRELKNIEGMEDIVVTAADIAEMVIGELGSWGEEVDEEDDGHEDECQICGLGGDLIMCDSCPRCAHLECVGMTDIGDDEDWFCLVCVSKIVNSSKIRAYNKVSGASKKESEDKIESSKAELEAGKDEEKQE